ncbi:MAG: FliM/FliN family flagellar motor switch protein [Polyangiales bacterium]
MTAPFPFDRLARFTARDVDLTRLALRLLSPAAPPGLELLGPRWGRLLGAPLHAAPSPPTVTTARALRAAPDGAALALVAQHPRLGPVAALLDAPLARWLCARALRRPEPPPGAPLSPDDEGALAALASRAALALWSPSPPPVVLRAVTDELDDVFAALGLSRDDASPAVEWRWTLASPEASGALRVVIPGASLPTVIEPSRVAPALHDLRVPVSLVAGRARWSAQTVASLRVGDVLLAPSLSRDGAGVTGGVSLVLGANRAAAIAATLARDAATLSGVEDPHPRSEDVSETEANDAPVMAPERAAGLSVEVSLELARMEATVAEVSAWRAGEVVAFPAGVGDAVTVRAGGRALCRGELVVVEGRVGVRVVEFL